MKRVVIIGAGGHAREVAEILRQQTAEELTILGYLVDDKDNAGAMIGGLRVLGDWSSLEGVDRSELFLICAVGLPDIRKQLVERAQAKGFRFTNAVSPLAYVSPAAKLGGGVMVFPFSHISAGCTIMDHAIINTGATLSHDTSVGAYGTFSPGVHVAGNVSIGEGSFLGIGACVVQGVTIGSWSTVGAGAAVIRDLPANVTAVGVPAQVIRSRAKGVANE